MIFRFRILKLPLLDQAVPLPAPGPREMDGEIHFTERVREGICGGAPAAH